MCFLYWRVWRETEKRYKDLTTLFLVSAVGGRVRTTPGHVSSEKTCKKVKKGPTNLSRGSSREQDPPVNPSEEGSEIRDPSGICVRMLHFLCYPLIWMWNRFAATDDDEDDEDIEVEPAGHTSSLRGKPASGKYDEMTSTTEDDDACNTDDYESTSAASSSKGLASDSIYTILITLSSGKRKANTTTTPTTTSSACITPLTEPFDDTLTAGHSIKQFFESAVVNSGQDSSSSTSSIKKTNKVRGDESINPWTNNKGQQPRSTRLSYTTPSGTRATTSASTTAIQSTVSQPKSEKKAAKTLSAILLAFIITWTPYNVFVLIKTLKGDSIDDATSSVGSFIPESLWNFSYYLCYINSTINPFCYALCNVNFRNTYIRILKCQWTLKGTRAKRAAANLEAQFTASQGKRKHGRDASDKNRKKSSARADSESPVVVTSSQVKRTPLKTDSRTDTVDSSGNFVSSTPSGSKRNSNRCKT